MQVTISKLRADIYRLLDRVAATGEPLEVHRKGKKIVIATEPTADKLSRLKKRSCITGNPVDLAGVRWPAEWQHDLP